MFVDASALVAILASEDGADALLMKLQQADIRHTSPMAIWETSLGLGRHRKIAPTDALALVMDFLKLRRLFRLCLRPAAWRAAAL